MPRFIKSQANDSLTVYGVVFCCCCCCCCLFTIQWGKLSSMNRKGKTWKRRIADSRRSTQIAVSFESTEVQGSTLSGNRKSHKHEARASSVSVVLLFVVVVLLFVVVVVLLLFCCCCFLDIRKATLVMHDVVI